MRIKLSKRVFLNFVLIIALFGILGALVGAMLINRTTLNEAQLRVNLDLRSAWNVIQGELDKLNLFVGVLGTGRRVESAYYAPDSPIHRASLEAVRRQCEFDFLSLTDARGQVIVRTVEPYNKGDYLTNDPFVSSALKGKSVSGFAILSPGRLRVEGGDLEERAFIVFEPTPKAKFRPKTSESAGMALVAAAPIYDENGNILGALHAGILLNRNHALVDKIRSIVFEDEIYDGRYLGTVTIFQWDTRIATNVKFANGNRATGTRVSADVYDKVLENNLNWYDRAFVVNDWYISAYNPIHDIEGRVIGILYVGVLAKKYNDIKLALWKFYGGLSFGAAVFVLAVGLIFARRLTGSLRRLADAAGGIATGDLNLRVEEPLIDDEIRDLTRTFNAMASSLHDREEKLKAANIELEDTNASLQQLNANYLDMLGFVSHELKNTLGVIYTSARALDAGLIGPLSEKQGALIHGISRNIDSAVRMTRNYLNLAQIERGELKVEAKIIDLISDVVNPVLGELEQTVAEQSVIVENELPETLPIMGDPNLLLIVYKNLLTNALKYGCHNGKIRLGFKREEKNFRFEVWNEGEGLSSDKISQLFQKFVRLQDKPERSRSTGLGLFITKDIVTKHGGVIWAESEVGKWINFIFTLPFGTPEDAS
ncbi:MAG: cache domain-containing protein [Thermodesulfobacteriota bacterium]